MAYDEELAVRLREALAGEPGVSEQKMFGGLAFLVGGHLAVAASGQGGAMLRAAPEAAESLLEDPHAELVVMRGRSMRGWLSIDAAGLVDDQDLARWVAVGVAYVRTLPPKRPS